VGYLSIRRHEFSEIYSRRTGLDPRPAHVGFTVVELALGQVFASIT
jgi:hypothetical protein